MVKLCIFNVVIVRKYSSMLAVQRTLYVHGNAIRLCQCTVHCALNKNTCFALGKLSDWTFSFRSDVFMICGEQRKFCRVALSAFASTIIVFTIWFTETTYSTKRYAPIYCARLCQAFHVMLWKNTIYTHTNVMWNVINVLFEILILIFKNTFHLDLDFRCCNLPI